MDLPSRQMLILCQDMKDSFSLHCLSILVHAFLKYARVIHVIRSSLCCCKYTLHMYSLLHQETVVMMFVCSFLWSPRPSMRRAIDLSQAVCLNGIARRYTILLMQLLVHCKDQHSLGELLGQASLLMSGLTILS